MQIKIFSDTIQVSDLQKLLIDDRNCFTLKLKVKVIIYIFELK